MALRVRVSAGFAADLVRDSILFYIASALVGALAGYSAAQAEHPTVGRVMGITAIGIFVPLAVVFLWMFVTIPRRVMQNQISNLNRQVEAIQGQLATLTIEKFGEPLRFLPVYHELRVDVREAIRVIDRAEKTGRLWGWMNAPEYRKWNKHKEAIATNPWAQVDGIHGELLEAFDHCERLATKTSVRFNRRVQERDDLGEALIALRVAEGVLTRSIDRLSALQSPDQMSLEDQP